MCWFHKWTAWSTPKTVKVYSFIINKVHYVQKQERKCQKCGRFQEREVNRR